MWVVVPTLRANKRAYSLIKIEQGRQKLRKMVLKYKDTLILVLWIKVSKISSTNDNTFWINKFLLNSQNYC